jgi:hypothetical protein
MVPSGDVLPIFFDTFDGGTGASITMTGLAVTDIEIYKDGSVTQRASDAGYTLLDTDGIDFDALTGIHGFSIDTGDNTDAGFYTVGAWFHVVVSAITVDAQTVSFVAAAFRIMAAEGVAGVPDVNMTHVADTAQTAGDLKASLNTIDDFIDTEVAAILSDTNAILVDTAEIGAAGAGLTALASQASVNTIDDFLDTEIAAILADTNELQTDWVNGGRLDLLIDAIKAKTDALPTDPADASDVAAAIAALNDLSAAEVNAEVVDALATDSYVETTGVPAASATLAVKLGFLYEALRNKVTVTSTKMTFFDDALVAQWEKDLSDDGTTYTESEGNAI